MVCTKISLTVEKQRPIISATKTNSIHMKNIKSILSCLLIASFSLSCIPPAFAADKVRVGPRKSSTEAAPASTEAIIAYENSRLNTVDSSGALKPVSQATYETVTTTNVITAAETESVFLLNAAGGFTSTLPAPAAGLHFTFIVKTAPTTAYLIKTTSSANIIKGQMVSSQATAGDTGTTDDNINFVASSAVAGDKIEVYSDGTSWFAYGNATLTASITFTTDG